jgi:hypothetical protein
MATSPASEQWSTQLGMVYTACPFSDPRHSAKGLAGVVPVWTSWWSPKLPAIGSTPGQAGHPIGRECPCGGSSFGLGWGCRSRTPCSWASCLPLGLQTLACISVQHHFMWMNTGAFSRSKAFDFLQSPQKYVALDRVT